MVTSRTAADRLVVKPGRGPTSSFFAGPKKRRGSSGSAPSVRPGSSWSVRPRRAVLGRSARGLDPAPGGRGRPPRAGGHARRPGRPDAGRADGRRRRTAPPSGPVGHAVAGRAGARRRARRPVRRGGGPRHARAPSVARRQPHPERARRAHAAAPAPHRRRSGSRCAPSAPVATSCRKSRADDLPQRRLTHGHAPCGERLASRAQSGSTRAGPSPTCRRRRRPAGRQGAVDARRSATRRGAVRERSSQVAAPTGPSSWRTARRWRPTRCSSARLGRVALVATRGFADVIEIARQARPSLYDQHVDRPAGARAARAAVRGGWPARRDGRELEAFDGVGSRAIPDDVDAVAVCLLHADLECRRTNSARRARRSRARRVSTSRARTRSRPSSASTNAWSRRSSTPRLRPVCRAVPRAGSRRSANEVLVMTSAGGLVPLGDAADAPGRVAAVGTGRRGARRGRRRGGVRLPGRGDASTWAAPAPTSASCAAACPSRRRRSSVGGFPIRLPALDVHTIGAGGGSIARLDRGGALVVGPESAGAPARARRATGAAATAPTVTDADLVLGRIPADAPLPGLGRARCDAAARRALARAGVDGRGRRRGRRRGDGARRARRDRRAGRRSARARARRVRRRGAVARVRDRRRARDAAR